MPADSWMDSRYYAKMILGIILVVCASVATGAGVPARKTWAVAVSSSLMPLGFFVLAYNECPLGSL